MFDFFDFNGDGEVSPGEAFVGASFVGSIGYGAGLSGAEEYYDYEDRKSRKRKRDYEPESYTDRMNKIFDDIDVLMSGWDDEDDDDFDDDDDWDDDDDDDDDWDDDFDDDDDDDDDYY